MQGNSKFDVGRVFTFVQWIEEGDIIGAILKDANGKNSFAVNMKVYSLLLNSYRIIGRVPSSNKLVKESDSIREYRGFHLINESEVDVISLVKQNHGYELTLENVKHIHSIWKGRIKFKDLAKYFYINTNEYKVRVFYRDNKITNEGNPYSDNWGRYTKLDEHVESSEETSIKNENNIFEIVVKSIGTDEENKNKLDELRLYAQNSRMDLYNYEVIRKKSRLELVEKQKSELTELIEKQKKELVEFDQETLDGMQYRADILEDTEQSILDMKKHREEDNKLAIALLAKLTGLELDDNSFNASINKVCKHYKDN